MPNPAFFARLGLFVREDFFDAATCQRLRDEALAAPSQAGEVARTSGEALDVQVRRVRCATMSQESVDLIEARLLAIREDLGRHFQESLTRLEDMDTLVYRSGDLYKAHRDGTVTGRKVSVVVFLNPQGPLEFQGGDLTFYGLLNPKLEQIGVPLQPEAGVLVAFRSDVMHEVQMVTEGNRVTIAAWFL